MSKEWLTLREASELLGIHPSTLRRWSDDGKIPFVRTPGGHRRFHRQVLEEYMQGRQLPGEPWSATFHGVEEPTWAEAFDEVQRARVRELGQRLLGLLLQYITGQQGDRRYLEEGRDVGRAYGETIGQTRLSLLEVVEVFLFFRSQIMDMAFQTPSFPRPSTEEERRQLHSRIDRFLNHVLLGTIEGFEQATTRR
ncbi:MAG: helix-turn-helix domain-containing protein [Ardenticatenia bacterium]|nr:helix-turn-helix domain-containing protein [Ardenticatenia bacterium]